MTWADTYITDVVNIGPALETDGQTVGIEVGSSFTGLSQQLTSGNGATMDIVSGGSFDGLENAVRIYPPTATVGSGDAEYACWLRFLDLWNSANNNIAQMNFRVLVYYGPRYYDLAPNAKSWGFQAQTVLATSGGDGNNRSGVFDNHSSFWSPWRYPFVTVETNSIYGNPYDAGDFHIDDTPDPNKLIEIRGGSPNHSASPPQTGGEWVCFEHIFDTRQNRGNANGLVKLLVWTRDGLVSAREISGPLTHGGSWNFSSLYIYTFEGLGFYFNDAGTAHADNYVMFSHATFAANMANTNTIIGPPPGFLDDPGEDTTPNAFTFTDQTGVARSSTITSAAITVSGIDAAATISVTGGTYDINGSGTFVSTSGTVNNGNTVRARHTSSASYSTATNTVVTIGGVSDTFTSTTESEPVDDTTPDAFAFTDQTDVARSTVITSAAITVAGIDAPTTISVSGGTYDINGSGTFVSTSGTVEVGDTVRARHTSSSSYGTATNTVVTIGGVSDTFTSTTIESDWTAHDLAYLPIVPGSAGFGTNQWGGSGRHLGGANQAAIFFIDDRGTGETGSWDSVTRIGYGTTKWCANHSEYGHVVWLVNGLLDYTGAGSRNIQVQNSYKTFHGHTAPGHIAYRGTLWATNGQHLCFWHIPIFQDLYDEGDNADCTTLLASPVPEYVLWANCLHWFGSDECTDWFRSISNSGFWQSVIGNALVEGNHSEGQHNYGTIFGDQSTLISMGRSIIMNCQARFPLSYAPSLSLFNCLMYNWAENASQIAGDSEQTDTNIEGCLYVAGPNTTSDNAIRLYSSLLSGSRVYLNGNRGFGVTEVDLVRNDEGLTLQLARLSGAFQSGTAVTPIGDRQEFAQLVIDHVGPRPASRHALIQSVLGQIINEFVGSGTLGSYPDVPSDVGYPSITNGATLNPASPGEFWGGVPCPMDLATRNQIMPSGYTRFEEWSHGVADQFMPAGWAGGESGGDDTTPNAFSFTDQTGVTRSSTITSASITVSGIDASATITVTGGQYSINGGSFTSSPGTVESGDTVQARHTSSASYATATNTTVTIGGVSDTFTSTTESEIIIPAHRWFRVPRR